MSLCPVPSAYHKLWATSHQPKLVHVTQIGPEASRHPRVLHSNEGYSEVTLILSGKGEYFIGGQAYEVQTGDLVFFNPGVAHDQKMSPGEGQARISLAISDFQSMGREALLPAAVKPVIATGSNFETLRALMELIFKQLEEELPARERTVHHLTQAFLTQVEALIQNQPAASEQSAKNEIPLATRVRAYLDENFCEEMSLQSLADRFNISSYYLAHIFKDQFGYPPLQYILRRRIGLAQTLLITTDMPVGEIGAWVGYYNPSHFNLIFTKNVGISPRKYRMNYLN